MKNRLLILLMLCSFGAMAQTWPNFNSYGIQRKAADTSYYRIVGTGGNYIYMVSLWKQQQLFAPISGGSGYIQNNPSSKQTGSIWITGDIETDNGIYSTNFNLGSGGITNLSIGTSLSLAYNPANDGGAINNLDLLTLDSQVKKTSSGNFVNTSTNQTVGGNKEFTGTLTLSSVANATSNYKMLVKDISTGEIKQIDSIGGGGGSTPSLQDVTDIGATTTNNLSINNPSTTDNSLTIASTLDGSSDFQSHISFTRGVNAGAKIQSKRDGAIGGVGLDFLVTPSNVEELSGAYTNALRILNTGDVGIGTTSPLAKLDVNGGARFDRLAVGGALDAGYISKFISTAADNFNAFTSTSGTGEYGIYENALYFQALTLANGIRFYSNPTDLSLRIDYGNDIYAKTLEGTGNRLMLANSAGKMYTSALAVTDTTTSIISSSTLSSTYSSAIEGFQVICPNITGGGLIYTKYASGWVQTLITIAP